MAGDSGAVVRQGYLRKLKSMKRKYFVLYGDTAEKDARLEYFESEKKFKSGSAPRRVLFLKSCYYITRRLDLKQRHVISLSTTEEQFCICADGEAEVHGWLDDILKLHHSHNFNAELINPTNHVWQVNVQKKGLGASKNIVGLYNMCLTHRTLTLVKIKANNNIIGELSRPDRVEFSLRNIRRCGDSECFFYMEVGRQTGTGAGELWMLTDDSSIAQNMHTTIYHAMSNCREDIGRTRSSSTSEDPRLNPLPARRQTFSDPRGRAGLANANTDNRETDKRAINHHRTVSLPIECTYKGPLKINHEKSLSDPLTGDEIDRVVIEKATRHSSCKAVNGYDYGKKTAQGTRRASTGTRFSKLSPAHTKNSQTTIRSRCDSMPSRICPPMDTELSRNSADFVDVEELTRDEIDATVTDWHRTPRIPEEPDYCDMNPKDNIPTSSHHSRHSSLAAEDASGYLPMMPALSASSGSVSGTPSTDPRFSDYPLESARSYIVEEEERPTRAYSVGSRPTAASAVGGRMRAYSVGAGRGKSIPANNSNSAPMLHPQNDDLMEIDFTPTKTMRPPTQPVDAKPRPKVDEYVDMSPRNRHYVEMSPRTQGLDYVAMRMGDIARSPPVATTPDGYVEMSYGKKPEPRSLDECGIRSRTDASQTLFSLSLDSPSPSQPEKMTETADIFEEEVPHTLTTVSESEEGRRSPEQEVTSRSTSKPIGAKPKSNSDVEELSCNPLANKACWAVDMNAPCESALNYAALDLEPTQVKNTTGPRTYSQIDFVRSEKLNTADSA